MNSKDTESKQKEVGSDLEECGSKKGFEELQGCGLWVTC